MEGSGVDNSGICLEGLRKMTELFSQDNRFEAEI
jgi:hypothetical protein